MPRDERTYITLHDGMPDHPKVDPLSDGAFRLLVAMWCWCSRNETDGRVPAATWTKRGTVRARRELIEAGLVEVHGDKVEMHDYLEHQRSAAEIADLREKRRAAGAKGGKAKASAMAFATASATAKGVAGAEQTPSKSVADTETERTRHTSSSLAPDEPAQRQRPRDELFDAVAEACGIDPKQLTDSGRGALNAAVKQLRAVDASPNQVKVRAHRYRQVYKDAPLTPPALAKHWAAMASSPNSPAERRSRDPLASAR